MTRVLVTGGTGELGSLLVPRLESAGYTVRIVSTTPSQLGPDSEREWAQADLGTGDGLAAAVQEVDVVVHAASDPRNSETVDVEGTRRLLDHCEDDAVDRLVYVSIVGIDAWADGWFPYYRHKLDAERAIQASPIPAVIQRATQFHSLLDGAFQWLRRLPVWLLPTAWQVQPVAPRAVADRLVNVVEADTTGHATPIGGPVTHTVGDLAATWRDVHGVRRPTGRLPIPGTIAQRVRDGAMTVSDGHRGEEAWREWLDGTTAGD